ncbi:phage antirepressor N-terminal domain-containing protein [Brevundimonas diminuta]|uniref:phage antirepressor N-terminal domain-containing protein n=1 Tax=Brevundimonas diminuta TaxID=293 RepID=UPI0037CC0EEC
MQGTVAAIDFHGDRLFAYQNGDQAYVAMRPIVEALGLDWSGQYRRIMRDEVLSGSVAIMATVTDAGEREALCLPLSLLNGWLFGVDASRVKPDLRDKITLYRRECFQALSDHFKPLTRAPVQQPWPDPLEYGMSMTDKRQLVNEARVTFDRQSARELWIMIGLPVTDAMLACASAQMTEDIDQTVIDYVAQKGPVSTRDITRRFQGYKASVLQAALARAADAGRLSFQRYRPPSGGRPTVTWSAPPVR